MCEDITALQTIRSQTLDLIATLSENPKPSYRIDGQEVSWAEYLDRLRDVVDWCDRKLAECQPAEFRSRGVS